jgi:hypothetical protein
MALCRSRASPTAVTIFRSSAIGSRTGLHTTPACGGGSLTYIVGASALRRLDDALAFPMAPGETRRGGTATVSKRQISLTRGVLPDEMCIEQIRRFARDVLPKLQAHRVARVPPVEAIMAVQIPSGPMLLLRAQPHRPCHPIQPPVSGAAS